MEPENVEEMEVESGDDPTEVMRELVFMFCQDGLSATQSLEELVRKYRDRAPTLTTVYNWRREFRGGKGERDAQEGDLPDDYDYYTYEAKRNGNVDGAVNADSDKYCSFCKKELSSRKYYELHMAKAHQIIVGYTRGICDVLDEMNESERNSCIYRCDACDSGQDFTTFEEFTGHKRQIHEIELKLRASRGSIKKRRSNMSRMEAFGMEEEEDECEEHEMEGDESYEVIKKGKREESMDDDEAGGIVRRSKRVPKPTIAIREHFENQQVAVRHGHGSAIQNIGLLSKKEPSYDEHDPDSQIKHSESGDEEMEDNNEVEEENIINKQHDSEDFAVEHKMSQKPYRRRPIGQKTGNFRPGRRRRRYIPRKRLLAEKHFTHLIPREKIALVDMPRIAIREPVNRSDKTENLANKGEKGVESNGTEMTPEKSAKGYLILPKRVSDFDKYSGLIPHKFTQSGRRNPLGVDFLANTRRSAPGHCRFGRPRIGRPRKYPPHYYEDYHPPYERKMMTTLNKTESSGQSSSAQELLGRNASNNADGNNNPNAPSNASNANVSVFDEPLNETNDASGENCFELKDLLIELGMLAGQIRLNVKNDSGHVVFFTESIEHRSIAFSDQDNNILVTEIQDNELKSQEIWSKAASQNLFLDAVCGRCYKYFFLSQLQPAIPNAKALILPKNISSGVSDE